MKKLEVIDDTLTFLEVNAQIEWRCMFPVYMDEDEDGEMWRALHARNFPKSFCARTISQQDDNIGRVCRQVIGRHDSFASECRLIASTGRTKAKSNYTWSRAHLAVTGVNTTEGAIVGLHAGIAKYSREWWIAEVSCEKRASIAIRTTAAGVSALLRDRSSGGKRRRDPVLHWVSEHSRKISTQEEEVDVRAHLRGHPMVQDWHGYTVRIHPSIVTVDSLSVEAAQSAARRGAVPVVLSSEG